MKKIILICLCFLLCIPSYAQSSNEELWNISTHVISTLKDKNMESLADLVHPVKGVYFVPDACIPNGKIQSIPKENLLNFFEDKNTYTWGYYDGSGHPIKLTKTDYYNKWIYDKDFLNADQIGVNTIIGKGNSTYAFTELFPNTPFVEYHFKGFDESVKGLDWESIRLVFEKYQDHWYLIAIVHDHWTI